MRTMRTTDAIPEKKKNMVKLGTSSSRKASSSIMQKGKQTPSYVPSTKMSFHLIAELILPYVSDRPTWNNVCSTSKELYLAGKNHLTLPPWPNTAIHFGGSVPAVAFSPSKSHLAFSTDLRVVHVWDRWGKETLLAGHTGNISCLEYSSDGKYLASGAGDASIRLWHTESLHTRTYSSNTFGIERRTTTTRIPEQADKILLGHLSTAMKLAFSRTDSNLLASGGLCGEIKLWNVKEQACIYSFQTYGRGNICSLFFAGGDSSACIVVASNPVTEAGSIIRLWKAEGSSEFTSETIDEPGLGGHIVPPAFSPCGSFLTSVTSSPRDKNVKTIDLYELETMTKIQSVVVSGFIVSCFALSPDSKQLVIGDIKGRIRLLQTDDFSIQRDLNTGRGEPQPTSNEPVWCVAFDPTCRVLAFGCRDGRLVLRTL
jgi:WD40 repeat protein